MPDAPSPFGEIILKVCSRCDLACDYCYMYELGDDTWKTQPRFMEAQVIETTAEKVASYVSGRGLSKFRVLLHGGEPLLAGADRINHIIDTFKKTVTGCDLTFGMQTNAVGLTQGMFDSLPSELIIGVSLDGDEQATSRHRLRPNGMSSHSDVLWGLSVLRRHPDRFGGILAVMDPRNDPRVAYEALREQEPYMCDFLFPLATRDNPPADLGVYGRWLADVFDIWHLDTDPRAPIIRLFHLIVDRLLSRDARSGFIGPPPPERSLVIQPDGSAELLDALRVVGNGAAVTGLSILTFTLKEIGEHPGYTQPDPCRACENCPVFDVCGGGYYPHRFSTVNGYDNPSVYCEDLVFLIGHIRGKLESLSGG
jgi:uncharacterized protein